MSTNTLMEFNEIKKKWGEYAVTESAKERINAAAPILNEDELRKELRDTDEARDFVDRFGFPPLTSVHEAKEIMEIACKEGCLLPIQLEKIRNVLVSVKRLKAYLSRGVDYDNSLAYYELNLESMDELCEEIEVQIRGEEVDDRASAELRKLRNEIAEYDAKMKQKAEQVMKANKACLADNFYTIRNGRVCIPVKKDFRYKIEGSAVDKSSTGSTVFVEPAAVSKMYEQQQLVKIDEENEVYRILYTLTAMVADGSQAMEENMRIIEKLDYIFSKGRLSAQMDGISPVINTERNVIIVRGRHPLMNRETVVPLDFSVGEDTRGVVITGPNTGGKTVAIKTVALVCMMAQCGLHVTAESANVCMNSSFLCDIGDGQNLTENLSTFSAHIKNVMSIIDDVDQDSLVIMDELGSGTDPTEGMGIAIAILEELRKSGCLFLVTTHYPEVKEYALRTSSIINARMEFNKETLQPTFRLIVGEAGESCAFFIAEKLGMPDYMLDNAKKAAYGDCQFGEVEIKRKTSRVKRHKIPSTNVALSQKFNIGDSVYVMPDMKIGIVCEPVNEEGILRVQMPDGKIYINHKRVKLNVPAQQLYPEDYDFSIIFDSVENRKLRHDMGRKFTKGKIIIE
ncbi:MAG: DNA mismatch repair protein MutS [Butyrivibrio sp.]|nr:DNA mismatch repair protein MutS [Butyrivibrio sp.]